jgi:hypothetical protein
MKHIFLMLGLALVVGCGGGDKPAESPNGGTTTTATPPAAGGDKDTDGDGIADKDDKCPDKKEDGQAPDPKDGCPKS